MKKCCHCKVEKLEDNFYKNAKSKDGLKPDCIECHNRYYDTDKNRENCERYRKNHPEEIKLSQKLYYEKNKEKVLGRNAEWQAKNPEKVKDAKKRYKERNRETLRIKNREYSRKKYIHHPIKKLTEEEKRNNRKKYNERKKLEKRNARQKLEKEFIGPKIPLDYKRCSKCEKIKNLLEFNKFKNRRSKIVVRARCKSCEKEDYESYRSLNKEKLKQARTKSRNTDEFRKKQRNYENNRYYTDSQYNLKKKYRIRLRGCYKKFKNGKKPKSNNLLGCSWEEFDSYIKLQFTEEMTEQLLLAGEIDIDHYIPCEAFILNNIEEAKVCFHWSNLRPEWSHLNESKNDKYPDGTRASENPNKYTLEEKKQFINDRLKSLNLNEHFYK